MTAKTLVLVHSTGATPAMWDRVTHSELRATMLTPANLGYPPSPRVVPPMVCDVTDDVRHVAAQIPPSGEIHLVGHSYGGLVALHLLPKLGSRVASVFLFEPMLSGALSRSTNADPRARAALQQFTEHPWFLTDEARGGTDAWLEIFIDFWNKAGSFARLPDEHKAFLRSVGWKMFQEVRSIFHDTSRFEDHVVSAPLTLMKAERSPIVSRAMVDEMARVNPGATLVDAPFTGHMAPITHAEIFAKVLFEHLSRHGLV